MLIQLPIKVKASNVPFATLNLLQTFMNRTCRLLVLKNLLLASITIMFTVLLFTVKTILEG